MTETKICPTCRSDDPGTCRCGNSATNQPHDWQPGGVSCPDHFHDPRREAIYFAGAPESPEPNQVQPEPSQGPLEELAREFEANALRHAERYAGPGPLDDEPWGAQIWAQAANACRRVQPVSSPTAREAFEAEVGVFERAVHNAASESDVANAIARVRAALNSGEPHG